MIVCVGAMALLWWSEGSFAESVLSFHRYMHPRAGAQVGRLAEQACLPSFNLDSILFFPAKDEEIEFCSNFKNCKVGSLW